jgi:hypothetical protein
MKTGSYLKELIYLMSALRGLFLTFAMGLFATAAFAQGASTTLGESMGSGRMSQGATQQFVGGFRLRRR